MNDRDTRQSVDSMEQLIQLLQSDDASSIPDDMLAALSEEQLGEFQEIQQAMELLNQAKPHADQAAVDSMTIQQDPTAADGTTARSLETAPPDSIGHYEVVETLAAGGFGIVVKARDTKLGRIVALKIPRIESLLSGPDARARFAREARLVAMLGHPAIVPVYEAGADGPLLFIASAFCDGGTLGHWFHDQGRQIAPDTAAQITARLAEAVQHAHARGVIHRDLKPGNVLLHFGDQDPGSRQATVVNALRIADFGLARFMRSDQAMTQTGATIGTPAYMSPEQARGAVDEIGEAADIYALGAILYELLTGRPPIVGESNLATMRAIETETPVPPRQINREVPPDLDAICRKSLEKQPRHRYRSAQDLEDDLNRYLAGQSVLARPAGPLTRLNRWSRRNPLVAGSLGAAFAALAVGLACSITFAVNADRARRLASEKQQLADAKSDEALAQARLARQAVDHLQRAIADEPKFKSEGMEEFKLNLAAAAKDYYQLVTTQRPNDPDVLREYVDTLRGLAYLQQLVGNHEDAAIVWDEAATIMREAFPDDLMGWAAIRSKLAEDLLLTGRTGEAVTITNDLVSRLEDSFADTGDDEVLKNLVFQLVNAAQNLNHQGRYNDAEPLVDQAISLVTWVTGTEPDHWPVNRNWARVLRCKAEVANQLGKHADIDQFAPIGIRLYRQLMSEQPERTSEALDSMATLYQGLAMSCQSRGDFELAMTEFENQKKVMQQLMERHPDVAGLSFNWSNYIHRHASALVAAGEIDDADQMLSPHLEWLQQQLQKYPQMIHLLRISEVECRGLMAEIDQRLERHKAARQQLDTAVEVCQEECQSDQAPLGLRAFLGHLYTRRAEILLQQGETAEAVAECQRAIDVLEPIVTQVPAGDPVMYLQQAQEILQQAEQSN